MELYSNDGRKLLNYHIDTFYYKFRHHHHHEKTDGSDTRDHCLQPFTLDHSLARKNCQMISNIASFCGTTNDNDDDDNNSDENEFAKLLSSSSSAPVSTGNNENQNSTSITTEPKETSSSSSLPRSTTTTTTMPVLDCRGLSCASLEVLVAFSIWLRDDIADCYKQYKDETLEQKRSNRLKAQNENPQLMMGNDNNNNNNNNNQQPPPPLHQWEPVLSSRVPQRVSFDLSTCFPSAAAHAKTRNYLKTLALNYSWDTIAQLHLFSIFVGCDSLSKTVANFIGLHLRQKSMKLKENLLFCGGTSSIVYENHLKKHVFSSSLSSSEKNGGQDSFQFQEGTAAYENPELVIEDVRRFKLEMMMMTTSVNDDETDRRGGSSSPYQKIVGGSSNDNNKKVVDDKVFEETVGWIRNALGVK